MSVYDTQNEDVRESALSAAVDAVVEGKLIVLPTDTVYGIGADAFAPDAVQALLEAKGRGRDVPPPVLIGDQAVLMALAADVADYVEELAEQLWPGPLTLILTAQPSLTWDLGETRGTVALRMPEHETALELLRRTGPLAVSSANRHGKKAALTVLDAATQLGDAVDVYLDGGDARLGEPSTIIDTTVRPPEIVREGALSKDDIIAAVGDIFAAPVPEEPETSPEQAGDEAPAEQADGDTPAEQAGDETPADETDDSGEDGARGEESGSGDGAGTEDAVPAAGALNLPSESDTGEDAPGDDRPGEDAHGNDRPGEDASGEDRPGEYGPGDDRPAGSATG